MSEPSRPSTNLPENGALFVNHARVAGDVGDILRPCVEPLGFTPTASEGGFEGTVDGRVVKIGTAVRSRTKYSSPNTRYRAYQGFTLELTLETSLQTRLALSPRPQGWDDNIVVSLVVSSLARSKGMQKLAPPPHSDLAGLRLWAFDVEWTHNCLADGAVHGVLRELMVRGDGRDPNSLASSTWSLGPGMMQVRLSPRADAITPENVRTWVESAVHLARLAESKPTNVTAGKTRLERKLEANPKALVPYIVLLMVGVPIALLVGVGLFMLVGWALIGEWVMIFPIVFLFFFMPYAMFLVFRQWFQQAKQALSGEEKSRR